jgi:hypothetical protein
VNANTWTKQRWSESNSLIADMLKYKTNTPFTVHRAWILTSLPKIACVSLDCCCQSNRMVCKMLHVYCFYVILNGLKYAGLQRLDLIGISAFCLKWSQITSLSIFMKEILIQQTGDQWVLQIGQYDTESLTFARMVRMDYSGVEKELNFIEQ